MVIGFQTALPNLLAVVPLLALFLYVWAVMGTTQFGRSLPDEFGNLGNSLYTLFQTATLENWPTIADKLVSQFPVGSWLYLLPFMLITAFAVFNLFIAVMVDAMQSKLVREVEDVEQAVEAEQRTEEAMLQSLGVLTDEVQDLNTKMAQLDRRASMIGKRAGVVAAAAITALFLWHAKEARFSRLPSQSHSWKR
ncbi:hypothetical protein BGK72_38085 [Streptomyces agglomeratus]|nr:hypothetical protein BGK72_38085 [Streptomyces agglomeratus]